MTVGPHADCTNYTDDVQAAVPRIIPACVIAGEMMVGEIAGHRRLGETEVEHLHEKRYSRPIRVIESGTLTTRTQSPTLTSRPATAAARRPRE